MAKKKVHVFDRAGEYVVEPAVIELSGADQFRVVNHTDEDLIWRLVDPALPFGANILELVPRHGATSPPKSPVNTPNFFGVFSYQLIGVTTGKKARGNSDPVIIVEN